MSGEVHLAMLYIATHTENYPLAQKRCQASKNF